MKQMLYAAIHERAASSPLVPQLQHLFRGQVVNALRQVFKIHRRPLPLEQGSPHHLQCLGRCLSAVFWTIAIFSRLIFAGRVCTIFFCFLSYFALFQAFAKGPKTLVRRRVSGNLRGMMSRILLAVVFHKRSGRPGDEVSRREGEAMLDRPKWIKIGLRLNQNFIMLSSSTVFRFFIFSDSSDR